MAMISCDECNREVSSRAATCPGCGVPFAADRESAGSGVASLTTTQSTSKSLKLQSLLSSIMLAIGLVMAWMSADSGESTALWAGLAAIGLIWYLVSRARIWWHHS